MANGSNSLKAFRRELAAEIFVKMVSFELDEEDFKHLQQSVVLCANVITQKLKNIEAEEESK
jgi:hypothetical protein